MILVDTSVWVGHFRERDDQLVEALETNDVLGHAWVTGELAMGNLPDRSATVGLLRQLPQALLGTASEVLGFVDRARLWGRGIGFVDANLLVSALLLPGTRLWTRDRRLHAAAVELHIAS